MEKRETGKRVTICLSNVGSHLMTIQCVLLTIFIEQEQLPDHFTNYSFKANSAENWCSIVLNNRLDLPNKF